MRPAQIQGVETWTSSLHVTAKGCGHKRAPPHDSLGATGKQTLSWHVLSEQDMYQRGPLEWSPVERRGRSRRGQREVSSSSQVHRQPSLRHRHAKEKMALQSCPEVGKMARTSYAQVKECGCLERGMTLGEAVPKGCTPCSWEQTLH